jgi:competence protein ComEC
MYIKNLLNRDVKLKIFTSNVNFKDYILGFYAPSFDLRVYPYKDFESFIIKQHKSIKFANIFEALFFGKSLDYSTRKELSTLGISHLFALSGLHLGFISAFLFFVLSPFYVFFQKRYFPYRNRLFDLGIAVLILEFLYLCLTSFPSSLIRAFIMECVLFIAYFSFSKLLSFKILIFTLIFSFLIFFDKVFSIGFLLSFLGVYYIYLYFRHVKPTIVSGFLLSFYMFGVMFVWGHLFFGNFNQYQLFSPFVNIIFSFFYPFEILLHLVGLGDLLDLMINKYLLLGDVYKMVVLPFWVVFLFAVISIIAWKKKYAFFGINIMSFIIILLTLGGYVGIQI